MTLKLRCKYCKEDRNLLTSVPSWKLVISLLSKRVPPVEEGGQVEIKTQLLTLSFRLMCDILHVQPDWDVIHSSPNIIRVIK